MPTGSAPAGGNWAGPLGRLGTAPAASSAGAARYSPQTPAGRSCRSTCTHPGRGGCCRFCTDVAHLPLDAANDPARAAAKHSVAPLELVTILQRDMRERWPYLSGTFSLCQHGANSHFSRLFSTFSPMHQNVVTLGGVCVCFSKSVRKGHFRNVWVGGG